MASPKSGPWWVFWICVCSCWVRAPKWSNYALTNLLFSLCMFVQVIELLVNLPSPHLGALACPFTPKVLWTRECGLTLSPSVVFTFGLVVESIKELEGVSTFTIQARYILIRMWKRWKDKSMFYDPINSKIKKL